MSTNDTGCKVAEALPPYIGLVYKNGINNIRVFAEPGKFLDV
jgi:hypothetical protein